METNVVGLIPAAGAGKRIHPYRGFKELVPVGYKSQEARPGQWVIVPKVIAEYTLERMLQAGVNNIIVILNEHKWEIARFFGNGRQFNADIAYMCQEIDPNCHGMPVALDVPHSWIADRIVLMGMPDTIVEPLDCFAQLLALHREKAADLTLGVFPTDQPQRLAPVVIDKRTLRVRRVYDKPAETRIYNTWNIAAWSWAFTRLLHQFVNDHCRDGQVPRRELLLSDVFNRAVEDGLKVYGLFFPDGRCYDLGTTESLVATRYMIEQAHLAEFAEFQVGRGV